MADLQLRTARLLLRTERPDDRAVWREHMNTAQVLAYLGGPVSDEAVDASFDRMAETGELPFLLVERCEDGVLVGKCGLSRIVTPSAPAGLKDQVQIGWTLRADCWGKGYARESAQAMMAWAFDSFGCTVLYAQTSERNCRSWELMERLGLRRIPDLDYIDPDYPAEDNPTIVFAIGREDWRTADA
jgi:RimJ/RimL family protein N-acetyltransferase